ncbi:hypothetical protein BOTBODRAFT_516697 [Botryobasidium botryosum FD-172 SS1]|uniref:Uncharacterized protein n=1 Tax=Botryobasidium botryosum (strain FD-172 SS1) TaxID=930990 RepID=A0A067MV87_BOTB1|nr:hypothetical protein BOTBODRAFT_516697 [Botryobasidium botryosum FD-172 SS1]
MLPPTSLRYLHVHKRILRHTAFRYLMTIFNLALVHAQLAWALVLLPPEIELYCEYVCGPCQGYLGTLVLGYLKLAVTLGVKVSQRGDLRKDLRIPRAQARMGNTRVWFVVRGRESSQIILLATHTAPAVNSPRLDK